jgi:acyl carrier protein phosphodiesterase
LPLFSTFDEELEFLEDFDLDYARASLLESHARYYEAAELHLSENRPLEAVRAFIKDNDNVDSTIRAADTILEYFWRKCSFRIIAKTVADESMRHFIALADKLEANKLAPVTRDLVRDSSLKVTSWADQHPDINVSEHFARKSWAFEKSCA